MFELFEFAIDSMPSIVDAFEDVMHVFLDPISEWLDPSMFNMVPGFKDFLSFSIFEAMFTVGLPIYLCYQIIKWVLDIVL